MGVFVSAHTDKITGVLFLFDRLLINGHLPHGYPQGMEQLEQAHKELGDLLVEARLPQIGATPKAGYEGEGFVILRHTDTEVVEKAPQRMIELVRVDLG